MTKFHPSKTRITTPGTEFSVASNENCTSRARGKKVRNSGAGSTLQKWHMPGQIFYAILSKKCEFLGQKMVDFCPFFARDEQILHKFAQISHKFCAEFPGVKFCKKCEKNGIKFKGTHWFSLLKMYKNWYFWGAFWAIFGQKMGFFGIFRGVRKNPPKMGKNRKLRAGNTYVTRKFRRPPKIVKFPRAVFPPTAKCSTSSSPGVSPKMRENKI